MKRTNVVLDGDLLDEATRVLGQKTYSGAINQALEEVTRMRKVQALAKHFGSGLWEGNLAEMRGDDPPPSPAPLSRKKSTSR
ncbi:MAG: type II toxin-antitoxin system VapB family antitoxin [Acidobacteria bacterium]|nr:type II toxin-antitoxin system VapB family antitoxin [Acidobacteriota bacterium]